MTSAQLAGVVVGAGLALPWVPRRLRLRRRWLVAVSALAAGVLGTAMLGLEVASAAGATLVGVLGVALWKWQFALDEVTVVRDLEGLPPLRVWPLKPRFFNPVYTVLYLRAAMRDPFSRRVLDDGAVNLDAAWEKALRPLRGGR